MSCNDSIFVAEVECGKPIKMKYIFAVSDVKKNAKWKFVLKRKYGKFKREPIGYKK